MLYADFYFRMKRQDAVCVAGWTQGPIAGATLVIGETELPCSGHLTHLRADLPHGAVGFILRFELNGEILDIERTKVVLKGPDRSAPFPSASAGMEALIGQATDELFICLLLGIAEGVFAVEETTAQAALHRRALSMAANRSFMELPGAAVAQDQAIGFESPTRLLVTGWMGDDGKAQDLRPIGQLIDAQGFQALKVQPQAMLRPDLAGVQIRSLKVGVTSGYVALARLERPLAPDAVSLIGIVSEGQTIGSLRPVQVQAAREVGRHHENLANNLVDPIGADLLLADLLPSLPRYFEDAALAEHVVRPAEPEGAAYVVEHDLDHWLGRDLVRLVRTGDEEAVRLSILTDQATEGLIRSTLADRVEAGPAALEVELTAGNSALPTWAPLSRYLVVSTSATLFQTLPFATLTRARADGIPAVCHVLSNAVDSGMEAISAEQGIAALAAGQPFVAQIDQLALDPAILPQSLHLSQVAQMRWLILSLARAGTVTFVATPGRAFLPGRDPMPAPNRMLELKAMRVAVQEAAN